MEAVAEEEAAEAHGSPPTAARSPSPEAAVTAVPANEAENEEKSPLLFACFTPLYAFPYGSDAAEKNRVAFDILYSGRTKYSAFVSKLNKLSEEYLSPQKTQKAAVFFIQKILGRRMI